MDIVTGLLQTLRKIDAIWVIIDKLTMCAHFMSIQTMYNSEILATIYIQQIVHLYRLPISIISNRGIQFTSYIWRSMQQELALGLSLAQYFTHIMMVNKRGPTRSLRICYRHVPFISEVIRQVFVFGRVFFNNSSYHSIIQIATFEELYRRRCRSPIG